MSAPPLPGQISDDPTSQPAPGGAEVEMEDKTNFASNPDESGKENPGLDAYPIDTDIANTIKPQPQVRKFLNALQTIVITESIQIGPRLLFYIFVLVFLLPSVWSIVSSFIVEFPNKLFFDGCEDRDNQISVKPDLFQCFTCCNNRSFVFSDLIEIPTRAKTGQIITVTLAAIVALLSGPAYAQLTLMEHLALEMLVYGIVIRTKISCFQLLPVVGFGLMFGAVAGLYTWTQSELSAAFNDSKLGFGDVCDNASSFPNVTLYAIFNEDNPSLASGSLPRSALDYIKAFAVIFVPFIPVLLKMYNAASSTFEKISLDELVMDNVNASATFDHMKYEVEENDLMEAIGTLAEAKAESDPETVFRFLRRFFVCVWSKGPIPEYFAFTDSWGTEEDVQRVCSILLRTGKLDNYHRKAGDESPKQDE